MKKSRFTEAQIFNILKEAEAGISVTELCRKHGMSDASFYKWSAKYGGMDVSSRWVFDGLQRPWTHYITCGTALD